MADTNARLLRRERNIILGVLLTLAAIAWGALIWQSVMMGASQAMGLTMGLSAGLFLVIWVVMMIAMMFPTAAPMILMFGAISARKRQQGQAFVPTWIFVGAYLLVWSLCGVLAYVLAVGFDHLAEHSMWLMGQRTLFSGFLLALTGLYQLTPLKYACLSNCRTPLQFILTSWHDGYGGAFRMGVEHGFYCLGCCWLLFVILFPLGMMNIALLALITLLIYAEKSLPVGRKIGQVAGIGLIVYGVVVIFVPAALPMGM